LELAGSGESPLERRGECKVHPFSLASPPHSLLLSPPALLPHSLLLSPIRCPHLRLETPHPAWLEFPGSSIHCPCMWAGRGGRTGLGGTYRIRAVVLCGVHVIIVAGIRVVVFPEVVVVLHGVHAIIIAGLRVAALPGLLSSVGFVSSSLVLLSSCLCRQRRWHSHCRRHLGSVGTYWALVFELTSLTRGEGLLPSVVVCIREGLESATA